VNPRSENRPLGSLQRRAQLHIRSQRLQDIDGDGKPEVLFTGPGAVMAYAKPDPANPTGEWKVHNISEPGLAGAHGMGIGDVNGDGRMDVVNSRGWWNNPPMARAKAPWKFHEASFGTGGAEMGVYDVNGDGLTDVVTAVAAHGWGLAWFEQKRDAAEEHLVGSPQHHGRLFDEECRGVTFSEPTAQPSPI